MERFWQLLCVLAEPFTEQHHMRGAVGEEESARWRGEAIVVLGSMHTVGGSIRGLVVM